MHKTLWCIHSSISRELGTGALVQFPMIFQQAATRFSALCISVCLMGCVLYSAVWECPVPQMSYCTLTLSNKPANPSIQPAPSSDFYWPKCQMSQICWGATQEVSIIKKNLPKQVCGIETVFLLPKKAYRKIVFPHADITCMSFFMKTVFSYLVIYIKR